METFIKLFIGIALVVFLAVLMAWPTMVIWNYLMPDIFGLTEIDFWQALGINVLSDILFKSQKGSTNKS